VPLNVFGRHNLQNLEAARLALSALNIGPDTFYEGIASFAGTAKRLERIETLSGRIVYRDFAHAPSKVAASVHAVVERHAGENVAAILELHTFSSLSPAFVPHYCNTMAAAAIRAIVYDPETAARKAEHPLDDAQIREAFKDDSLTVLTSLEALRQFLAELSSDTVLLLMSSGNLMGLNVAEL
jgi:UDP-N-acetylmuramate: L-alanyl-gamma-D-glutamyl-meso-diaminopimelate ligase